MAPSDKTSGKADSPPDVVQCDKRCDVRLTAVDVDHPFKRISNRCHAFVSHSFTFYDIARERFAICVSSTLMARFECP
jgi:hypothetical protein